MVGEVAADADEVVGRSDAQGREIGRGADTREQQELGRADRARGDDHLTGVDDLLAALAAEDHATHAVTFDGGRRSAGIPVRISRLGRRPRDAEQRAALKRWPRRTVCCRRPAPTAVPLPTSSSAGRPSSAHASRKAVERVDLRLIGDHELALAPVRLTGPPRVPLEGVEVGKEVGPTPADAAMGGGPLVVVGRAAARVDHGVDGARAAQRPALRDADAAPVEPGLRDRLVLPGVARAGEHPAGPSGHADEGRAVPRTRLDHQHPRARGGAEPPVGEDAPGRARPYDHDVVCRHAAFYSADMAPKMSVFVPQVLKW